MTPHVRVVRGAPDELELAALVAGLLNGAGSAPPSRDPAATARRRWRQAALPGGAPVEPGPDAWRWSAQLPR